ncbi:hypothetical protein ODZ84_05045 [Chryseobacterium fluminis]|uniref:hypothetical protein n=1 Tax=Chryseobacterium fluminis TaxID=2983606 RepID=UPI002257F8BE|nr:hypothetical protein [Chryseobacterium sp. MMS21-Ot14]UZT98940.1 hypothetical protein ODZ84_05045 [Chryseobacterium sp. MMS21-Ot14]
MNYATTNHIGNDQNPTASQTEATAPTVGRVRRVDKTSKRCRRDKKGSKEIGPCGNASLAFLRFSFLPKLKQNETVQSCKESKRMERDFYQSLSDLAEHYQIDPKASQEYEYPYNMALAVHDLQQKLKNKTRDWEEIQLIRDQGKVYFTSEERYNTGATLYYIPVLPLYRLSKEKKYKNAFRLLLSVYSYLYHIVDIPYYRQEASYLYWMYDMLEQWVTEDDETEDALRLLADIKQAEWIGDCMERKIYNLQNLEWFESRLQQFKAKDHFDGKCLEVARTAFHLSVNFPNSTVFRNAQAQINHDCDDDTDENSENTVTMDKYISFCADAKGCLFDQLFQSVNNELQEYGQMEEPVIIKHFNGSDVSQDNLEFEHQIFDLITELIDLMNEF